MNCLSCHSLTVKTTWTNLFFNLHNRYLCSFCQSKLEKIDYSMTCKRCCSISSERRCQDCMNWENYYKTNRPLIKNISIYKYNEFLKQLITKWKYRGDYMLAFVFEKDLTTRFKQFFSTEKELAVVPMPLSNERLKERGFNQSEQLASMISNKIMTPLRRVHTEKQAKKSRRERLKMKNPFICQQNINYPVVLIDDIYTTGATIYKAAETLKENGCPKIYSLTLVRG